MKPRLPEIYYFQMLAWNDNAKVKRNSHIGPISKVFSSHDSLGLHDASKIVQKFETGKQAGKCLKFLYVGVGSNDRVVRRFYALTIYRMAFAKDLRVTRSSKRKISIFEEKKTVSF